MATAETEPLIDRVVRLINETTTQRNAARMAADDARNAWINDPTEDNLLEADSMTAEAARLESRLDNLYAAHMRAQEIQRAATDEESRAAVAKARGEVWAFVQQRIEIGAELDKTVDKMLAKCVAYREASLQAWERIAMVTTRSPGNHTQHLDRIYVLMGPGKGEHAVARVATALAVRLARAAGGDIGQFMQIAGVDPARDTSFAEAFRWDADHLPNFAPIPDDGTVVAVG